MQPMNWSNILTVFGTAAITAERLENAVFKAGADFSKDYNGGQWNFDSIGGCPVLVAPEGTYNVASAANYYSGEMDARTYGAAISLLLLNQLVWMLHERGVTHEMEVVREKFYALQNAVYDSKSLNVKEIIGFLD